MRRKIIVISILIILASTTVGYCALFGEGYRIDDFNFSRIQGKVYIIDYGNKQNVALYLYRRVAVALFVSGGLGKYEESLNQWKNLPGLCLRTLRRFR